MSITLGCSKFLNNNGVSCYRNSILAILQNLPFFTDHIININNIKKFILNKTEDEILDTATYQLFKLFFISLTNDNTDLNPSSLTALMTKKNKMWGEIEQQDSLEYLVDLLDKVREEQGKEVVFVPNIVSGNNNNIINPEIDLQKLIFMSQYEKYNSRECKSIINLYSPLNQMFDIYNIEKKYCPNCNNNISKLDVSTVIKLDFDNLDKNPNIYQLLDNYEAEKELDSDNKANCCNCYQKVQLKISNKLWKLPKILIIQLKRFKFDMKTLSDIKIQDKVDYPIHLDMEKYIDELSPFKQYNKYNLVGVNLHFGYTRHSGHYVSFVKNKLDDKWYLFNDSNPVQEVKYMEQLINNNASALFYVREN
jgi:ubiquitin C-terminal hydrolase